ncbi:uncharacterized protein KGF55_005432 [Candida pseudojiufengensis]|uniref:uncharacterized protein n=1 Tax=Candida pseudojiufengensis TaxID=497109 RepID=UPI0022242398|nr:uncharacterized protein KGF55_005432 [Candida pseudojiufengensis]KAI5959282.1 hypothetical protein KGF55_005432 [Candida pseudojiufengensis]
MNNEQDIKTIKLLNLLNEYQELTNLHRSSFINGFLNLSRANFQSETLKFNKDSWDLRIKNSNKIIKIDDELELMDNLKAIDSEDVEKETEIKNRKIKSRNTAALNSEKSILKDPILQFGALVPKELKLSQDNFNEGLRLSVKLINLRREIELLTKELDE